MDAAFTRPLVLARLGQFIMEVKVSSWPKLSACMPACLPSCLPAYLTLPSPRTLLAFFIPFLCICLHALSP